MLTAMASEDDRIVGLMGADDSLAKPFNPRSSSRAFAQSCVAPRAWRTPSVEILRFDEGRLEIDTVKRAVLRDGTPVDLTPNEYKLLLALGKDTPDAPTRASSS